MQSESGSVWACPICRAPLEGDTTTFRCQSRHSFDIAREGYLNLLPVQKRKSSSPGDSQEMMLARREFLSLDHYSPLLSVLSTHLPTTGKLLDLGCGEGYYAAHIDAANPELTVFATDISKYAVKMSARKLPRAQTAVASSFDLPIEDASFDAVMTVFAPVSFQELHRVLKPKGQFLRVVPAAKHLQEVRERVYDQVAPHTSEASEPTGFSLMQEQRITFQFRPACKTDLLALLKMTPHYWKCKAEKKEQLENQPLFDVTAEFCIQQWSKTEL